MRENDTMTIREMCDAFDVTPRALRFYEAKELLFPKRVGQKRLFTRRDRARLTLILRGKSFGIPLEDLRQLLDLYDTAGPEAQAERACEVARARLAEMVGERDRLDTAIRTLATELDKAAKTPAAAAANASRARQTAACHA